MNPPFTPNLPAQPSLWGLHRSAPWSMRCQVRKSHLRLRLRDQQGRLLLSARLPVGSDHPFALAALFEALASYAGRRLAVVVSAAASSGGLLESGVLDEHRGLGDSNCFEVLYDVPGQGLSRSPFGLADPQQCLEFEAVEF